MNIILDQEIINDNDDNQVEYQVKIPNMLIKASQLLLICSFFTVSYSC